MKPMTEEHFAVLRRHMVEVIAIHTDLSVQDQRMWMLQLLMRRPAMRQEWYGCLPNFRVRKEEVTSSGTLCGAR